MAQHARVEELSDDPDEADIEEIERVPPSAAEAARLASILQPSNIPTGNASAPPQSTRHDPRRFKNWTCIYPIYFDARKTRAQGRRVGREHAVENPLAREICDAVHGLGLQLALEAEKTHPKDWANPGRVRVLLRNEEGKAVNAGVQNKHHLYIKVAEHLKQYPTDESTPMRLRVQGMPADAKAPPKAAVPRGWNMGDILPLHSPAVSGGGVSENMFKDMMNEMQGGGPGAESSSGNAIQGTGKAKKEKKKAKG